MHEPAPNTQPTGEPLTSRAVAVGRTIAPELFSVYSDEATADQQLPHTD